ncbi:MAG: hypothetical protein M9949_11070 [Candidatus Kapabacteria bacterium]|nr:hypothetical protein [Candidatus Kapabacteria bacterium]
MKKYIICITFVYILIFQFASAQGLNNGATIVIESGAKLLISGGNYTNFGDASNNGEIDLDGDIFITGNFVNNAPSGGVFINRDSDGKVVFNGTGNSIISGTSPDSILFENITVESSATITNNHLSSIIGDLTLVGADKNITIGTGNLFVQGQIIGTNHSITAVSTGYLSQNAQASVQRDFPMGDGTNHYTLKIISGNAPTTPIRVRMVEKSVPGAIKDPMLFWDVAGDNNLNATIILRMDKSAISPKTLNTNSILRFFDGTEYLPMTDEQVTINDMGTYYEISIINVNQF